MAETHSTTGVIGATVNARRSFARFVCPFLFDPESFAARVAEAGNAKWLSSTDRVPVWEIAPFATDDLLAHVAEYLNPPLETRATAIRWKLTNDARQSKNGLANAEWQLVNNTRRRQPQAIPFRIDGVELALFSVGVGFVTLCVGTPADDVDTWSDLIHAFRFANGQRDVGVRAWMRRSPDIPFFPVFAGDVGALDEAGLGKVSRLVAGFLDTASVKGDPECWWEEVFVPGQLIPYVALFVNGLDPDELAHLVYRVRHVLGSRQALAPTPADLRLDGHPGVLPYTANAWFTFSLDGGGFVAGDLPDTPFFRDQLPEHLHTRYYPLFLLALHQRFALMKLSRDVADVWQDTVDPRQESAQESAVGRIRSAFLLFTTRGYFAQVAQQEHHHASYRRWQETFQIDRLYREISDEVREMSQHVLERRTGRIADLQAQAAAREKQDQGRDRRRDTFFGGLAGVLGGPALVLSFLSVIGPVSTGAAVLGSVIGVVAGSVLIALFLYLLHRQ